MIVSVNVYWSFIDQEWMRVVKPESVRKSFYEKRFHEESPHTSYHKCPFVFDHLENIYSLHSPYDYSFKIEGSEISTSLYSQEFFNRHVVVRSVKNKLFSFYLPFVFFTEEKSLEMNLRYPYMENNNITQRCSTFEGTIDIGKYFRNLDFTFFIKDPFEEFIINQGEIFEYVKFNTKEKIIFKKFIPTDKIKMYLDSVSDAKNNQKFSFRSPSFYYDKFSIKKAVLKEIKNNLVD